MADYRPVDDAFPLVWNLSPHIDLSGFGKDTDSAEIHATVKASALAAADSPPSRPGWLPSDWQGDCCPATLEIEAIRQWFEWTILGLKNIDSWREGDYTDDDRRDPFSAFSTAGNNDYRDAHRLIEIFRKEGMDNLPYRERGNFSASDAAEELRKLRDLLKDQRPLLSERQYRILQAFLKMKAVSADALQTTDKVVKRAEGGAADPVQFKRDITVLKKAGFLDTKEGRGGGCWLTTKGRKLAERLNG